MDSKHSDCRCKIVFLMQDRIAVPSLCHTKQLQQCLKTFLQFRLRIGYVVREREHMIPHVSRIRKFRSYIWHGFHKMFKTSFAAWSSQLILCSH